MKNILRNRIIDVILDLAGDEFETKESIIKLCAKSNTELIENLIEIAYYFQNEEHNK